MKKFIIAALGLALAGIGANAYAATGTGTINPSLIIATACTVDASAVSSRFPSQNSGSTTPVITMAGGNMVVLCPGLAYSVGANVGANSTANQRRLTNGTHFIPYKLTIGGVDWGDKGLNLIDPVYTDTFTTTVAKTVASGAVGGDTFAISGVTTSALGGGESLGTYTDTVTITVAY